MLLTTSVWIQPILGSAEQESNASIALYVYGRPTCMNTRATLTGIASNEKILKSNVKIIFQDIDRNSAETVKAFEKEIACDKIVFLSDTTEKASQTMWSLFGGSGSVVLPVTAYFDALNQLKKVETGYKTDKEILSNISALLSEPQTEQPTTTPLPQTSELITSATKSKLQEFVLEGENVKGQRTAITPYRSTNRWATVPASYLYQTADGYTSVDCSDVLRVAMFDKDFRLRSTQVLNMELPLFGGFYAAEDYNYVLFGAENKDKSNTAEVLRLVRYNKNFERIDAGSIKDCYTVLPFEAGSSSIAESNGKIMVHTCRLRYDGHQSQLTVIFNKSDLAVTNSLGEFQSNHVSHSFNQIVKADGNQLVLIDHGDAYPRCVNLTVYDTAMNSFINEYNLFKIPGEIGANCTGVTVGGLEVSDTSYLVPINTIDHSKVSTYTSFNMVGLDLDERDIVLLIKNKNDKSSVRQLMLTNYVNQKMSGSTPQIVKLNNNRFVVLWQEFLADANHDWKTGETIKYILVDGNGNPLSDIQSAIGNLSGDCQPICIGNDLVWYINYHDGYNMEDAKNFYRSFYKLSLTEPADTVSYTQKAYEITVGETAKLAFNCSAGTPEFSSSDETIATVSADGVVIGLKQGEVTITAKVKNQAVQDSCSVEVKQSTTQQIGRAHV